MVDLRDRTKHFARPIIKLYTALPHTAEAQIMGELLAESQTIPTSKLQGLMQEAQEIMAILGTLLKKAKQSS